MNIKHINTFREYINNRIDEVVKSQKTIVDNNVVKPNNLNDTKHISDLEKKFDEIINSIDIL